MTDRQVTHQCPTCSCHTKVLSTRHSAGRTVRRRECLNFQAKHRFTTVELLIRDEKAYELGRELSETFRSELAKRVSSLADFVEIAAA